MIGLFSDSHGDMAAFDAAYDLLRNRGAKRFFFAGGRYTDFDEWMKLRREIARGGRAYSDSDFLADVTRFVGGEKKAGPRPGGGGGAPIPTERFVRTPEKDTLAYQDPSVGPKALDLVGDVLCCLVHDKNDLTRDDLVNALLFIHGRSSEPKVVQIGPRYFATPGQLVGAAEQTVALLEELTPRQFKFSAFTLDGQEVIEASMINFDRRNKIDVKG